MTILSNRHMGDTPKTTEVATKVNRALFRQMLTEVLA